MQVGAAGGFTVVRGFPGLTDRCGDIAVDPTNPNVFFAVDGGPNGPNAADVKVTHRIRRGEFDPAASNLTLTAHPDLPDVVIGGVTVSKELNHVNTVVLDPDNAGVMFVGTDLGVYRGAPDPGGTFVWSRFSDGLPAAVMVTDLKLHRATRRLRAATMGRGIWEIPLDAPDRDVDLYLRDTLLDYGLATAAAPTVATRQDPLSLRPLSWNDGADLRVDTETQFIGGFADPPSSVRYDGVDIDFLGFEALGNDPPRSRARSRVFVQIHNRGPGSASDVDVRLFVGKKTGNTAAGSGGYPDLPANFWADVFTGAFTGAGVPFRPAGPAQRIASVLPAAPHIARFEFEASGASDTVGLLAVVGSAADPVPAALPLTVETAIRSDKHVALKETTIAYPAFASAIGLLLLLGVATAAVIVVARET
jgi:hypothetical protein